VYDPSAGTWSAVDLNFPQALNQLTTFGEDEEGNVYLVRSGTVYLFSQTGVLFVDGFESGDTTGWDETVP
jgi:hypothetical protein